MAQLSDSQLVVLSAACQRPDRSVYPLTAKLPGGAAAKVLGSLLKKGLVREVQAKREDTVWREDKKRGRLTLHATSAALHALGIEQEEAARDLYADGWQAFCYVTLPLLFPGVVAGFMLAFIISLDDFIITNMVTGPGATTLPLAIYGMVRTGLTPEINAISTLLLGVSMLFVTLSYLIGDYEPKTRADRRASIASAMKIWALTLAFMVLCAFLFKISAQYSRATILLHAAGGAVAIKARSRLPSSRPASSDSVRLSLMAKAMSGTCSVSAGNIVGSR